MDKWRRFLQARCPILLPTNTDKAPQCPQGTNPGQQTSPTSLILSWITAGLPMEGELHLHASCLMQKNPQQNHVNMA